MKKVYKRTPNCNCKECGKEIYRRPSQIAFGSVFCSSHCSNIRNKIDAHACIVCGNSISTHSAKTCSRACANKNRTGVKYRIGRPKDKANKSVRLKRLLLETGPARCNRCHFDKVEILQVHHVIERCNGGTDEIDNLELLCPNCHVWHHHITNTTID